VILISRLLHYSESCRPLSSPAPSSRRGRRPERQRYGQ